ncbi:MAG: ABC transporter permease [Dehalococcoidia bacterium]|jgi:ABC-type dipeptide/oligopeptide/nickel transport system permease subunit
MVDKGTINAETLEMPPRVGEFRRSLRIFMGRGIVIFGLVIIVIFLITAAFAPLLAPYGPYEPDLANALSQPSTKHLLGTDNIGRDTLSRIIYGTRISLMVGIIAVGIAAGAGMTLGLLAGYFGGWTYTIIMRFMDALMAFPQILLALLITSLLGGGLVNVMIALGISLMPGYARIMCGQVLTIKENDYIIAGHSMGSSNIRMMLRHILPNSIPPLIVMITMMMGTTILAEAGLSYLGIGVELPTATWGGMVSDGYMYLTSNPILSFAPGLAIMIVVFSFNMVGDGLRDALDPRLRGVI